ncbi:MAG: aldo/keto reductase [Clostridia bacterium]|nr:aldo/keto reductase [Clostridia bacterium]
MKKIRFERAGLDVSNMCLGTMMMGTQIDEKTSMAELDLFVDMGGTFIDTSNNYAHWMPGATGDESEVLIGKWLKEKGGRDKIVLASKVGYDRHGEHQGLKASQIEYWCDESLRKLNTDYLDLYYAHVDDFNTPLEETMEAFDKLVKKGKVKALGVSNYYTWRICEAKHIAKANGFTDFTVNQPQYSFLYTKAGRDSSTPLNLNVSEERLDYLKANNMPMVTYSCLASGGYDDEKRLPDKYVKDGRWDLLQDTAKELGLAPSSLVLAWLMNSDKLPERPTIVPLVASSRLEHLKKNLEMSEYELDVELMKKLCYTKF